MADSIVRLKVEDGSFNAKIKEAARSFADFGKRVASAGADAMADFAKGVKTAKVAFQGFNAALKANALVLVASLAVQAASAIGEMIGDWISGADDAAEAQKRLNVQLEETKRLVEQINDEGDFNARIAKAQGKSTSDILQMKVESARQAYNVALANVLDPKLKAGTEEYDKAKKIEEQAQKRLQKALQDQQIDAIARQYRTGEYAARGGGGKSGRGSDNGPSMLVNSFNKYLAKSMNGSVDLKEVKDQLSPFQMMLPEIEKNILGIKDADLGGSLARIGEKKVVAEIDAMNKSLEQQKNAFSLAAQAASNFGSAMSSIGDPSAKAAGQVTQAIASIALGFAMASSNANTAGTGWGWLAWLGAGMSAMATTIATIHSLTGYAEGGMIKGNSYSGDNLMAMGPDGGLIGLNAGEIVLNKAQQSTLAQNLQGNGGGGMRVVGEIQGEKIVLVANRYFKRTGQGEIVTW